MNRSRLLKSNFEKLIITKRIDHVISPNLSTLHDHANSGHPKLLTHCAVNGTKETLLLTCIS